MELVVYSWCESEFYSSLTEIERNYEIDIPFPQKLIATEKGGKQKYTVETEKGQLLGYQYTLRTKERSYDVSAFNRVKEKPQFTADTNEKTVIDKEIFINGVSARLLGIHDMNGYHIYIEKVTGV